VSAATERAFRSTRASFLTRRLNAIATKSDKGLKNRPPHRVQVPSLDIEHGVFEFFLYAPQRIPARICPAKRATRTQASHISSKIFLKVASASLAQKVGVIRRWTDRNGFGGSTEQIAKIVSLLVTKISNHEIIGIPNHSPSALTHQLQGQFRHGSQHNEPASQCLEDKCGLARKSPIRAPW